MLRPQNESGIDQLQNVAINVVEGVCAIVCRPIEMILRPRSGSRYYPLPVVFLSTMLMIFLPLMSALATGITSMLPGAGLRPPIGLFGIDSLSKLYFLLSFVHGIRIWRLMLTMDEIHSEYEGEPLPFFEVLPKGDSFFFTRIVLEPAFVLIAATVLGRIYVFQSGLVLYLQIAALMLAMKEYIIWFKTWEYLRGLMDAKFLGLIIAKMLENKATKNEMATIHMASFPKKVAPEMRQATLQHIARASSAEASTDGKPL